MARRILEMLSAERRRIVAKWRILIFARRASAADGAPLPHVKSVGQILKVWARGGGVSHAGGLHDVYRIDVPFAAVVPVSELQVVQEAAPFAVFSHLTAMSHHGLTDVIPRKLCVTHFGRRHGTRLPLGTTPEDWVDLEFPIDTLPERVDETEVEWSRTQSKWDFGECIGFSAGLPIYVTDLERTLLDGLRAPVKVGGMIELFRAWRKARDAIHLDKLVEYVERFDSPLIRQRVGYLLDELDLKHDQVECWRARLQRGGSLKLAADLAYAPTYSERWNLSLNVPDEVLNELRG